MSLRSSFPCLYLSIAMLLAVSLAAGCASMGALVSKDGMAALNEPASLEVSLDRLEDVDESLKLVNQLLFETPIDENSQWVAELTNVSQPVADSVKSVARQSPVYGDPQRRVMELKVYRTHTSQVLAGLDPAAVGAARYGSVIEALGAVAGAPGEELAAVVMESKAMLDAVAETSARIGELEAEAEREGTAEIRRQEIATEIASLEAEIEAVEGQREALSTRFDGAVAQLSSLTLSGEKLAVAKNAFAVLGHAARIELQAITTLGVIAVQVPRALPQAHQEIQTLVVRWANDAAAGVTSISPSDVRFDLATLSVEVPGLEDNALSRVADEVVWFYESSVALPGRATSIGDSLEFQADMFVALSEALAALTGAAFVESSGFVLDEG